MTPGSMDNLSMAPSEYFRRQIHSCFWFERGGIAEAIESVGADHLCSRPTSRTRRASTPTASSTPRRARGLDDEHAPRIMQENAARLYRIPL